MPTSHSHVVLRTYPAAALAAALGSWITSKCFIHTRHQATRYTNHHSTIVKRRSHEGIGLRVYTSRFHSFTNTPDLGDDLIP